MAIIKCKMCGGDLILTEGQTVAECEYCGSRQTVPTADSEKKLVQFERAERLRKNCEFDKAAGIYESIVSEFRTESEAYWGLFLCKYGIEYVDDPATGKKVPTCHRSSFDSVMEDSDLEQALENADAIARKVYREEAKQIEEIRKGIIEVSGKEEPYDIFICYKETDENGERTIDSVIAQDVYDALASKGYRVFFSRITLEDKLGQEYEPYIFAALNSAKIMLAFGTDYEYYNAVWVKNEWSRYLKLMASDKSKHLIPCYKGIDAYDMPKEFAKLQAQDMGKVGAMQDLLRGIEKILPKATPVTVVQERVVVGGSGDNKIASLLDRGNMALEDGDWAKADSFFEDVLNNDSKNAQAYLGKTLAQERCRTIDAFARKRKKESQYAQPQKLRLEPNEAHVDEMVDRCAIPGYVQQDEIRKLYQFDLSYTSEVAERMHQHRDEVNFWANHKLLSRAEKFAAGAVAENFQREKKALFAALADRVKQAENAEATAKTDVQERYEAHLKQADQQAEALYNAGVARREAYYQELLGTAKQSSDIAELTNTAKKFDQLGDYQDSRNLAEHCRKRAAEEQAKLDAEKERQRVLAAKREKERKARNTRLGILAGIAAVVVIVVIVVMTTVAIPAKDYKNAEQMLIAGEYDGAIVAFEALNGYKDSAERIIEAENAKQAAEIARIEAENAATYAEAEKMFNAGDYDGAIAAFEALGNYKDSSSKVNEAKNAKQAIEAAQLEAENAAAYAEAEAFLSNGDEFHAAVAFYKLKGYQDAWERCMELWETIAQRDTFSVGKSHTVALKKNGTVLATSYTGKNGYSGQCEVSGWTNIIAVSAGAGNGPISISQTHTVGLREDGTVVAVGGNNYGQCNVSSWTDIVTIDAGGLHTVGLKADGTVIAVGDNSFGQCDVSDWTDIIAVSAGAIHTVGLKADGTVVAVGNNTYGQCDASKWRDIVAISAGGKYTVALCSDGTVVAVGDNGAGQCNVSGWTDIVSICAFGGHTVGLRSDGTVVAVGNNIHGPCDVSDWTDIVAISAGSVCTIGLKSDGTLITAGSNLYGEKDVSDWTDVKLPD